jgi:hypothetical protein
MVVTPESIAKGQFQRGYNGTVDTTSVGQMAALIGEPNQPTVDSCYNKMKQQLTWIHPRGMICSSWYGWMFGDTTKGGIPFPIGNRNVYGERVQKWKIGIVYSSSKVAKMELYTDTIHSIATIDIPSSGGAGVMAMTESIIVLDVDNTHYDSQYYNIYPWIDAATVSDITIHTVTFIQM